LGATFVRAAGAPVSLLVIPQIASAGPFSAWSPEAGVPKHTLRRLRGWCVAPRPAGLSPWCGGGAAGAGCPCSLGAVGGAPGPGVVRLDASGPGPLPSAAARAGCARHSLRPTPTRPLSCMPGRAPLPARCLCAVCIRGPAGRRPLRQRGGVAALRGLCVSRWRIQGTPRLAVAALSPCGAPGPVGLVAAPGLGSVGVPGALASQAPGGFAGSRGPRLAPAPRVLAGGLAGGRALRS